MRIITKTETIELYNNKKNESEINILIQLSHQTLYKLVNYSTITIILIIKTKIII